MSLFGRKYADGDRLDIAGAVVQLKVNGRTRRISLRLDRRQRQIIASAPSVALLSEAATFARTRAQWIKDCLAALPEPVGFAPGMTVHLFGQPCQLELAPHTHRLLSAQSGEGLRIAGRGEGVAYARATLRTIQREALRVLTAQTEQHCQTLGVRLPSIAIMDARSRWGSCRAALPGKPAAIRYSWRLALAPLEIADYVAAHECAHLLELNHGPQFWAHVESLVGDPRPYRAWLRAEGGRLHAIGLPGPVQAV